MTKQITDKVLYKDQKYILAGLKGMRLYSPVDFGISSEMMGFNTACYRGYFCTYACIDKQLFLVESFVSPHHRRDDIQIEFPVIDGVLPKSVPPDSDSVLFKYYEELKIPFQFSGGLILVRNLVGPAGHFPNPKNFKEVVEVLFEDGIFRQEVNHSKTAKGLRNESVDRSFISDYEQQPPIKA